MDIYELLYILTQLITYKFTGGVIGIQEGFSWLAAN